MFTPWILAEYGQVYTIFPLVFAVTSIIPAVTHMERKLRPREVCVRSSLFFVSLFTIWMTVKAAFVHSDVSQWIGYLSVSVFALAAMSYKNKTAVPLERTAVTLVAVTAMFSLKSAAFFVVLLCVYFAYSFSENWRSEIGSPNT